MAVLGAVVGDILGSSFEYNRTTEPMTCELIVNETTFTDDTVMTLAIKKAIDTDKDFTETMREVGAKYPWCGYGNHFFEWIFCTNPQPYNSYGNGAAMRVSYIGEHFEDIEDVKRYAEKSAAVSHNHPEGIKGAVTTAVAIWMAKHGCSKDDIFNYIQSEYPKEQYRFSIDKDLNYLKENYSWDVTCMTSVPVAMRCFYESTDYISFIRNVLSLDCDADTLCAIGGAVAEEFYGGTGINNEKLLQDILEEELLDIFYGHY